jgi:hypothetical protein
MMGTKIAILEIEEFYLLGYNAMSVESLAACFMLVSFLAFDPGDGGDMFL